MTDRFSSKTGLAANGNRAIFTAGDGQSSSSVTYLQPLTPILILLFINYFQWVKCWSTELAVPSSIPARGEIFSTVNGVPL